MCVCECVCVREGGSEGGWKGELLRHVMIISSGHC